MRRFALLVPLAACVTTRVETMSQPTTLHLRLATACDGAVLEHYEPYAYRTVRVAGGTADVDVPAMAGGYSERGGHRYNIHEPGAYEILRLRRGDVVLQELSLVDVAALPTDADGRAIVECSPGRT